MAMAAYENWLMHDWLMQLQEVEAQRIIRIICEMCPSLGDVELTKIDKSYPIYQLLCRDDDGEHRLLPYWSAIDLLPDAVLATLVAHLLWVNVSMETIVTKLATRMTLHGMAITMQGIGRLLNILTEACADGYERAEYDERVCLCLSGEVRLEVAQEKAADVIKEGIIHADEVWMYLCGWMQGYQDARDQIVADEPVSLS